MKQILSLRVSGAALCIAITTLATFALASVALAADAAPAQKPVNYSRDIKPILAGRCYACHGPDEKQRKGDLRLDLQEEALKSAIVPGKASESELIKRVTGDDPEMRMPPVDSKKPPLTAAEVEVVRRWIDEGAKFDVHWSYNAPQRPAVPEVQNQAWPLSTIDRFILARLEQDRIAPSSAADRRTLIRRLSFDLTGLPPKPQDVDAFVADTSPLAYEQLVDRLLASPAYGERMAMYWLDQVRYADTTGIHGDNHRDVAPYRDYVINAYNQNMPFDRFTIEQLAGDLLPTPTRDQRVASGYNRMNMTTQEGGAQAKEYIAKYSADRVRAVSSLWLASTMGCCECHNHKFDPFSTKDFYSFAAFFADIQEVPVGAQPQTPVPTAEQLAQAEQIDRSISELQSALDAPRADVDAARAAWETSLREQASVWKALKPDKVESSAGSSLSVLDDISVRATAGGPASDTYTITAKVNLKGITGIRLEVLADKLFPASGPGRAPNGNFVLNEITLAASDVLGDPQPVKLQNATATHEQGAGFTAASAIATDKPDPKQGWAIAPQFGKANSAVFETAADVGSDGESLLVVKLRQEYDSQHTIGRFRISVTTAPRPLKAQAAGDLPTEVADIVAIDPAQRTPQQQQALAAHYRTIAPLLEPERQKLAAAKAQKEALAKSFPMTLVSMAAAPREMRILPRGNWLDESGELVQPSTPAFLHALGVADRRATRLDLAQWMVSPENPLMARVAVNRLWKICFGQGLVKSLEDFGSQGTMPSHPALLDWLAIEFRESGWNVKHILKLIVMSQAYRQSSQSDAKLRDRDPANDLLARQARYRLDAEMVRDNALAISGLLVPTLGGPSVKPYQPAGYWAHLNFPTREYQNDSGDGLYRRGLYTYWCRTFLHPSLLAFDAPTREECAVERPRSNTPLQALVLLNDPTYVEAARALAARVIAGGGASDAERIAFVYREALSRKPTERETAIVAQLLEKHRREYAANQADATELMKNGAAPAPATAAAAELAAWTSVARVILNLHETITRN